MLCHKKPVIGIRFVETTDHGSFHGNSGFIILEFIRLGVLSRSPALLRFRAAGEEIRVPSPTIPH